MEVSFVYSCSENTSAFATFTSNAVVLIQFSTDGVILEKMRFDSFGFYT